MFFSHIGSRHPTFQTPPYNLLPKQVVFWYRLNEKSAFAAAVMDFSVYSNHAALGGSPRDVSPGVQYLLLPFWGSESAFFFFPD